MVSVYVNVCPDVNQGETNHNRSTQTCTFVCKDLLMNPDGTPKPDSI